MDTAYTWTPPVYTIPHTSTRPPLQSTLILPPDPENPANFMRAAKWSPDGLSALGSCENATFQLFDLPDRIPSYSHTDTPQPIQLNASLKQPSPILDFLWYPTASRHDPASYCFVASVRECPVKLLDASTGRLRASYRIVDHCERQIAPHSMAFNLSSTKLYCGFEDAIEVFDVHVPGEGTRLRTTPSKKSKDGLKGIISALAFSPSASYTDAFYAAGSLSPTPHNIVLFSESQGENPIMYIGNNNVRTYGGVTQLRFHPLKPHILYASFRSRSSHGKIYAWDLRMADSGISDSPYHVFQSHHEGINGQAVREVNHNQKMIFDIDIAGRWLAVGGQAGGVNVFDLSVEGMTTADGELQRAYTHGGTGNDPNTSYPTYHFNAHEDAVGCTTFNPCHPMLVSVGGSRHFVVDEEVEECVEEDEQERNGTMMKLKDRLGPVVFDSSVKVWYMG
ncbi:hypothetical protein AX15_006522 [Amanita polypyramis BW_CC]|nr:hypothetical protein AX15_006522 [Amanita polypyramis BW_CC]